MTPPSTRVRSAMGGSRRSISSETSEPKASAESKVRPCSEVLQAPDAPEAELQRASEGPDETSAVPTAARWGPGPEWRSSPASSAR